MNNISFKNLSLQALLKHLRINNVSFFNMALDLEYMYKIVQRTEIGKHYETYKKIHISQENLLKRRS